MNTSLLRALPAVSLALLGLLVYLTFTHVDLRPKVDAKFFFTSDSAPFKEAQALDKRFRSQELLIITAATDDLDSAAYQQRIAKLTERLRKIRDVQGVRSIASGPDDLKDARDSPLWRRLLLLKDVQASLVVMVVDDRHPQRLVREVLEVVEAQQRADFRLQLAGVPYVVERIAHHLQHDFRVFSLGCVGVFALVILLLFRSLAILVGSLVACATAAVLTLLVQPLLGGRIGLLTANLITIAFVLTQSHVVFLTGNWRNLQGSGLGPVPRLAGALRRTLGASGWAMLTTLLGFVTLMFVEAQPLRELGMGGTLATVLALLTAYLVYPPFLLWARPRPAPAPAASRLGGLPPTWLAVTALAGALLLGLGALRLNTDPSLLEYFAEDSEVRRSLEAIDPYGGSSPLNLALRRADGASLDTAEAYDQMWALQAALQKDPAVGTIVSLPVLMAEADRSPLAFLFSWKKLLEILSSERFDRVAESFITADHREGLFMLRMVEVGREERRTAVIERLEETVRKHGFEVRLVGGIYGLQGRLADLVTRSLFEGLAGLLLAFAVIAVIVTRSLAGGLLMLACIAAVPAVTLGLFGLLRLPLDIVATPAINVALGVAVDAFIHLGVAWRLARGAQTPAAAVTVARGEQGGSILAATLVVMAGFAIFSASSFPPTQRFGMAVVLGAAVAAAMASWIYPRLLAALPASGPAARR